MTELGHVVLYVRELDRSLKFYCDVVGLTVVGRLFGGRAVALTGGRNHHELLLIQVGEAPGPLSGRRVGLYHIGWKVGETLDDLRAAKQRAAEQSFPLEGMADHSISYSLYLRDPDANEIELYVDNPAFDWKSDQSWLQEAVKPLGL